jgi:hypothetical protein
MVLKRNMIVYLRVPETSIMKVLVPMVIAGIVSAMFHGLTTDLSGIRNRNGVLFFLDLSTAFTALQ